MANRTRDYDRINGRPNRLRGGAFGGDYARDDWPYGLGGDYARDGRRRGFSGDYARDERWGSTGASRDAIVSDRLSRGSSRGSGAAFGGDQPNYRGVGPKNYHRSDERIAEDVNEGLTVDEWLDASGIEVEVKDGEVTLNGTVANRTAKRRAEDLAESCFGVRDVHNRLRVEDTESDVHIGKASE